MGTGGVIAVAGELRVGDGRLGADLVRDPVGAARVLGPAPPAGRRGPGGREGGEEPTVARAAAARIV